MRSWVLLCTVLALSSGCSRDLTTTPPAAATVAGVGDVVSGVAITATVTNRGSFGDSVVIHIANAGPGPAYLPRCGSGPLLLAQQFTNGTWTGGVQNFMCLTPSAPGPIALTAGASLDIVRVMDVSGRYRFIVSVAEDTALSTAVTATSNAFDIP